MTIRTSDDSKSTILQVEGVDKFQVHDTGLVEAAAFKGGFFEADYFKTPGGILTPVGAFKNKIINGDYRISRSPGPFAIPNPGTFTVDMWRAGNSNFSNVEVQRVTDYASEIQLSQKLIVGTANTSPANNTYLYLAHPIEGYNVWDLNGNPFTLSFLVRASKTGTYTISLQNASITRSYVTTFTIDAANEWEHKTITVPGGIDPTGAWEWTTGTGLRVIFTLASGSNYVTSTTDSWVDGNYLAATGQVNLGDTANAYFEVTKVQLERGEKATEFERLDIATVSTQILRYYREFILSAGAGRGFIRPRGGACIYPVPLDPPMRAVPTGIVVSGSPEYFSADGWTSSGLSFGATSASVNEAVVTLDGTTQADAMGATYLVRSVGVPLRVAFDARLS